MADIKEESSDWDLKVITSVVAEERMLEHSHILGTAVHLVHVESRVLISLDSLLLVHGLGCTFKA